MSESGDSDVFHGFTDADLNAAALENAAALRREISDAQSLEWDSMIPPVSGSLVGMAGSIGGTSDVGGGREELHQRSSTPADGDGQDGGRVTAASNVTIIAAGTGSLAAHSDAVRDAELLLEYGVYSDWSPDGWSVEQLSHQIGEISAIMRNLCIAMRYYEAKDTTAAATTKTLLTTYKSLLKEVRVAKEGKGGGGEGGSGGGGGISGGGNGSGGRNSPADISTTSTSSAIRQERAQWQERRLMARVDRILDEFTEAMAGEVRTTHELGAMEKQVAAVEAKRAELQRDLQSLAEDAIAGGSRELLQKVDDAIDAMQSRREKARDALVARKRQLGYMPFESVAAAKRVDVKPPVFNGLLNDAMDFFTFNKLFNEYCDVAGITNPDDKVLKLRFECLAGEAKVATANLTSLSEIMDYLERTYGKPPLLFINRAREMYDLGRCPAEVLKRRSWVITMRSKLQDLKRLAMTHNVMYMFDASGVLGDVQNHLLPDDANTLRKIHRQNAVLGGMPGAAYVEIVLNFLAQLEGWANADIEYLRLGKRAEELRVSEKQQKSAAPRKNYLALESDSVSGGAQSGGAGGSGVVSSCAVGTAPVQQPVMSAKSAEARVVECSVCNFKHTHLTYCKKYQAARVKERWQMIVKTGACLRCLRLDAALPANPHGRENWFNEHKPYCDGKWVCLIGKCGEVAEFKQNHITACKFHIKENQERQGELVKSLDQRYVRSDARFFFTNSLCYGERAVLASRPAAQVRDAHVVLPDVDGPPIYLLQYLPSRKNPGEKLLAFYDTGCYAAAISDRAFFNLECETVRTGPTPLEVAGGKTIEVPHGDERFYLELDGKPARLATITALRMGTVSAAMPLWPMTEAWEAVAAAYTGVEPLPTVESEIGGACVDVMIGIRYHCYYPTLMFWLPGGLGIYKSKLRAAGGHSGVLGGPHPAWMEVNSATKFMTPRAYITNELRAYQMEAETIRHLYCRGPTAGQAGPNRVLVDLSASDCENSSHVNSCAINYESECKCVYLHIGAELKRASEVDEIGGSVDYRCVKCRNCYDCTRGEALERASLVEEREQALIESCVSLDATNNTVYSRLPFIANPDVALTPNLKVARAILDAEMRTMSRDPAMRADVLRSHAKLVEKGHVVPLLDLPPEVQRQAATGGYFIPWRSVYNPGSLSTPCRMVFDASSKTPGGESLNNVLAKGQNKLAKLYYIILKFRLGRAALSADISMAYNALKLVPEEYRYQKYLWVPDLEYGVEPVEMVVRTMIYGVRSAGNLTMAGFQLVAKHVKEKYPELTTGADALANDAYMDDVPAAFESDEARDKAGDALVGTLAVGGMEIKALTKSGQPPCDKVSADGEHVGVLGYRWRPVVDQLGVEVKPLFFGKARRGKLPQVVDGDLAAIVSKHLTKRNLAGKVASIFDPVGIFTPFTAKLKLDMAEISKLGLDWDEAVPDRYLDTWVANLEDMQDLKQLYVPRCVLSKVGVDDTCDVIVCCDASQVIAAAAVYVRSETEDGSAVCNLLTAKSKLVNKLSIPRAELVAAKVGAALGHTVLRLLGGRIRRVMYVTDSSVALHWIHQDQRPLQVGVRNAVIEIRRLSDVTRWRHVESGGNPADIATRGARVGELQPGHDWFVGRPWMSANWDSMPVRTLGEIELSAAERRAADAEMRARAEPGIVLAQMPALDKVRERYKYSNYLVDPCAWPWVKFLKLMAVLVKCVNVWRKKCQPLPVVEGKVYVPLSESDHASAEAYLYRLTTAEVKQFVGVEKVKHMGVEVAGVLRYTGRVLDEQRIDDVYDVFTDLSPLSFVKPIVDRHSPVAYAVMRHAHEKLTHHGSAVATLRESRGVVYVVHGRQLAIEIREACVWCRRFKARMVEVELGKFHQTRLTIAPAFYNSQVDLFGPLEASCEHNHRSKVKVWGLVFKCPATLAVAVLCMQAYSTASFTQAYTRFSSRYGHPARLYIDAGSQLVKGCKELGFGVVDLTAGVAGQYGVGMEYQTCPVGAHNAHGLVERSVRAVREVFKAVFRGLRLDILGYETAFAWISNELNLLPICLGSKTENLGATDLITPSRLLLGRNNKRSPTGCAKVESPTRMMRQMAEVERAWWNFWKEEKLCDLIPRPAGLWEKGSQPVTVGDVVVFVDSESTLGRPPWRTGRVVGAEAGVDGAVRAVVIEYRNPSEAVSRRTRRSTRKVAVVHHEGDLELVQRLNQAARAADHQLHLLRFRQVF